MDEFIGERIKSLRKDNNLTQKKLADLTGLSEISIRKYENGERNPKFDTLEKISQALNVQVDYLLGRTEFKKFDSQIMKDDIFNLIKKSDNNNKEFSKLIRSIVDTMFLTINDFTDDKDIKILTIIHDLYRNIWRIKLIHKKNSTYNLLNTNFNNNDEEFNEYKRIISVLLDEFYNALNNK